MAVVKYHNLTKLYVNGCSHSAGIGCESLVNSWPNQLATNLGYDLVNHAIGGASNQRIIRSTREWLRSVNPQQPSFLILGLTSWERQEWLHEGEFYQINSSGHDVLPVPLQQQYKNYVNNIGDASFVRGAQETENQLKQLVKACRYRNINYLFFNSFMMMSSTLDNNAWDYHYMSPYSNEMNYYCYLEQQGFKSDKNLHFGDSAQTAWAQVLQDYIRKFYDIQPH